MCARGQRNGGGRRSCPKTVRARAPCGAEGGPSWCVLALINPYPDTSCPRRPWSPPRVFSGLSAAMISGEIQYCPTYGLYIATVVPREPTDSFCFPSREVAPAQDTVFHKPKTHARNHWGCLSDTLSLQSCRHLSGGSWLNSLMHLSDVRLDCCVWVDT